MLKWCVTVLSMAIAWLHVRAGDVKFPVSEIPATLLQNANAVVREDRSAFRIVSRGKAHYRSYYAVTILNSKAKDLARRYLWYDKLRKVSNISANIYDAEGKYIRRLKNHEIADRSAFDGVTLFSDNRYKELDLTHNEYPYTVEFEYEIDYNFLFNIDGSHVRPDENVAVQNFSYELIYPTSLKPFYKTVNIPAEPVIATNEKGTESARWSLQNVLPVRYEPYTSTEEYAMYIDASPSDFEFDGYTGNMSTWENYGKWQLTLNAGRDQLPEDARQKVRELTASLSTTEQKTRALFEYLQSRTPYVGIQLGIGGLQPFPASVVHEVGYGDCKALSNYMVAMLKEAGVRGYYTEVWAGDVPRPLDINFTGGNYGNHVIVGVPNGADTIWLECTSQTKPFGYMGNFTGDRKAIMMTENGGKVVTTQTLKAEENLKLTSAEVFVDLTGDARATIRSQYRGIRYETGGLDDYVLRGVDEQKKWIQENTQIPSFDIRGFSIANVKDRVPSAIVKRDLSLRRLASVNGPRMFVTANLMNRWVDIPPKAESRKASVVKRRQYTDIDSIHYHLPDGISPEFLPEPVKILNRFGEYEASFRIDGNGLLYVRRLKVHKGEFPPESYNEMVEFYRSISKADNTKIVFLNKT